MKNLTNARLFIVALALFAGSAARSEAREALVPVNAVFAPNGFDNNDDAQVVVSGYLPNLCYKAPRTQVAVRGNTVFVAVKALVDENSYCPEVIVPVLEPISLGVLPAANYRVVVNAGARFQARTLFSVGEASGSTIDDYVYANVDHVEVVPGSRRVVLKGFNPSDCFVFDRTEFVSNSRDTLSVLPILKQIRTTCPRKMVPFAIGVEIPRGLPAEEILLHVRVMDGKSVNTIFQNR